MTNNTTDLQNAKTITAEQTAAGRLSIEVYDDEVYIIEEGAKVYVLRAYCQKKGSGQVIAKSGSYVSSEYLHIVAEAGSRVRVSSGEVHAQEGSVVVAFDSATVIAASGAVVFAEHGSYVSADSGALVFSKTEDEDAGDSGLLLVVDSDKFAKLESFYKVDYYDFQV